MFNVWIYPKQQNQQEMSMSISESYLYLIYLYLYLYWYHLYLYLSSIYIIYQSVGVDILIYYKEVAHMIRKAGKSIICRVDWYAKDPGKRMIQYDSECSLQQNSLLIGDVSLFVLFRPSTVWVRPTHIMEGNLLYPSFTDLNVNLILKHCLNCHKIGHSTL